MRNIEMDFESVDHLRSEFLETADAMFGNGFVWLMKPPSAGGMTILADSLQTISRVELLVDPESSPAGDRLLVPLANLVPTKRTDSLAC